MIRRTGDRGATMVEFSIVALLLLALLLGIIEFSLVFRSRLTVNDAASNGVRIAAIAGNNVGIDDNTADYEIIRAIREETSAIDPELIDYIVIYEARTPAAGSPLAQVPSPCRQGTPVLGRCNVYDPITAFERVQAGDIAYFNCARNTSGPSCPWDPVTRSDGPNPADVDYIGVYIRMRHHFASGLFGAGVTIETAKMSRLEPGLAE